MKDIDRIKQFVKAACPFGKLQTPHTAYKSYVASMCVALYGLGFQKHEVAEIFDDLGMIGDQKKFTTTVIDLVFKNKDREDHL